jgi:hypothetical protein
MEEKMTMGGQVGGGQKKKKNTVFMEVKHGMTDAGWKQWMLEGQELMEEMMEEQVELMRELVEIFRKWPERVISSESEEETEKGEDVAEGLDKGKEKEKDMDGVEEDSEGGDADPLSSM